jgi:membrane protein implicated in regulation of membrane protease activity
MASKVQTFAGIMFFYAILAFIIGPLAFYYFAGRSLEMAGNGFVVGSIVSIALWYTFGKKMV